VCVCVCLSVCVLCCVRVHVFCLCHSLRSSLPVMSAAQRAKLLEHQALEAFTFGQVSVNPIFFTLSKGIEIFLRLDMFMSIHTLLLVFPEKFCCSFSKISKKSPKRSPLSGLMLKITPFSVFCFFSDNRILYRFSPQEVAQPFGVFLLLQVSVMQLSLGSAALGASEVFARSLFT
jgi:hypothetical protein